MKSTVIKYWRVLIGVAVYLVVVYKVFGDSQHFPFGVLMESSRWPLYVAVFLLMPVSWLFEALKWKVVVAEFQPISLKDSWKSVWYGVAAGQLTPNRVGEPFGRAALLLPQHRVRGVYAATWCGFSQQLATVSFGVAGIAVWNYLDIPFPGNILVGQYALWLLVCVWVATMLFVVFAPNVPYRWVIRIPYVKKRLGNGSAIFEHNKRVVLVSVVLSIIRYFVFSSQFLLLLVAFDVEAAPLSLYAAIWITYLFSSIIPTFAWAEAGVRAGFSILFVGVIASSTSVVALAAMLVWMINVALPALIGAWIPWRKF